MENLLVLGNW